MYTNDSDSGKKVQTRLCLYKNIFIDTFKTLTRVIQYFSNSDNFFIVASTLQKASCFKQCIGKTIINKSYDNYECFVDI